MGGLGVNYSSVSKEIIRLTAEKGEGWNTPNDLVRATASVPLALEVVKSVDVRLSLPKASLVAQAIVYSASFTSLEQEGGAGEDKITTLEGDDWRCKLDNIRVRTIVGLHPHERQTRQWLEVDVEVSDIPAVWNDRAASEAVYEVRSSFVP